MNSIGLNFPATILRSAAAALRSRPADGVHLPPSPDPFCAAPSAHVCCRLFAPVRRALGSRALGLFIGVFCILGAPCSADPRTDALLEQTGRLVELFWDQIPSFTCTESVIQEKIGKKGKIEYRQDSVFDYLAITRADGEDVSVEELRLPQKGNADDKPGRPPLLSTNGFPTFLLVFHPLDRSSYRYRMEPEGIGSEELRVRFEHVPGTRTTSALLIRERIYPLRLQGTAWIDRESGAILRMSARLIAPMEDINIVSFKIDVAYKAQRFHAEPETRWLPSSAVIELQTALQHWRNTHSYSRYKRFTVQAVEEFRSE